MQKLEESFGVLKIDKVLTGMALGTDQWVASLCIRMKIPFDAIVPFEGYDSKWPMRSRQHYNMLLQEAASVVTLSEGYYSPQLLHDRNAWMVDHSDALLAVWDGQNSGGTASCVRYAQQKAVQTGKGVYQLSLPREIWNLAMEIEMGLLQDKANRPAPVWRGEPVRPVRKPPPPKESPKKNDTITFRRHVEIGDDEPE
jgi:uncharacterized phage-like protein YoqJ